MPALLGRDDTTRYVALCRLIAPGPMFRFPSTSEIIRRSGRVIPKDDCQVMRYAVSAQSGIALRPTPWWTGTRRIPRTSGAMNSFSAGAGSR